MAATAKGLEKLLQTLAKIPVGVQAAVQGQLKAEVDDLVAAQKRAAPVDPASDNPGEFRDSIRSYPNPDRPLSYRIIADAKDEDGHIFASHLEHGHRSRGGEHVPASPSFFPTYRARKKPMRKRMREAAKRAIETPKG